MSKADDIGQWIERLAADAASSSSKAQLHAAALAFVAALHSLPDSGYREKALCSFADTLVLGYVAAGR